MKEQTMLVDCMIGDFSDPEAVSGGSTTVLLFFTTPLMLKTNDRMVVFCCAAIEGRSKAEIEKDPVTARKTGSFVWSVELYFGIDFCFWLLYKEFIQKLLL